MLRLVAVLVVVAAVAYNLGPRIINFHFGLMGRHRVVNNHRPGPCRIVSGIEHGSEDIKLLEGGKALITSGLRYTHSGSPAYDGRRGRMFLFDFNNPTEDPVQLTIKGLDLDTFDPSGMDVWVNPKSGETHVYVVNYLTAQSTVEKLRLDPANLLLVHVKTFTHPHFKVLNSVVLLAEDQFYFSNFAHTRTAWELPLLQQWGSVGWYDGTGARLVNTGMLVGNGLAVSPDHRHLYVSHTGYRELLVFGIQSNNSLNLKQTFKTYGLMDNLFIDPESGNLWAGAHIQGVATFGYTADPENGVSPSQVLYMHLDDGKVTSMTEVFQDDGRFFSGSSVAVHHKGALLVGSIVSQTMYCEVRYLH